MKHVISTRRTILGAALASLLALGANAQRLSAPRVGGESPTGTPLVGGDRSSDLASPELDASLFSRGFSNDLPMYLPSSIGLNEIRELDRHLAQLPELQRNPAAVLGELSERLSAPPLEGSAGVEREAQRQAAAMFSYLLSHPEAFQDAAVRHELQVLMGAFAPEKIEESAHWLQRESLRNPPIRRWLDALRRASSGARQFPEETSDAVSQKALGLAGYFGYAEEGAPRAQAGAVPGAREKAMLAPSFNEEGAAPREGSPATLTTRRALAARRPSLLSRAAAPLRVAAAFVLGVAGTLWAAAYHPVQAQSPSVSVPVAHMVVVNAVGQAQAREADYYKAKTIAEVVDNFSADTHLYVIGRLPGEVKERDLRQLAAELQGTHWYVVFARSASGQSYKDRTGGRHSGVEALDYGLGHGIGDHPDFLALKHPRVGESDGIVFGIYLDDHLWRFHTSEAQDNRGLNGKTNKDMGQWAIRQLKAHQAAGMVDAARDSRTNIDRLLDEAIGREVESARVSVNQASSKLTELERRATSFRQAHPTQTRILAGVDLASLSDKLKDARKALDNNQLARAAELAGPVASAADAALAAIDSYERDFSLAQAALNATSGRLGDLTAKSAAFARAYPRLTGDLARVDLAGLSNSLKAAQAELEPNPARAKELAQALESRVTSILEAIARYPSGAGLISQEQKRLAGLQARERADSARMELLEAQQALADAAKAYSTGDSSYWTSLTRAQASLASAERTVSNADAAAQEEARAAARAHVRNIVLLILAVLAALATGGVTFFFMNRRVRPLKARADKLLADWSKALKEKLTAAAAVDPKDPGVKGSTLRERFKRWVGPATGEEARNYSGETKRLADEARAAVGWVDILWKMAQNRVDETRRLVQPISPWDRVKNLVWPTNFNEALAFENKKVTFKPNDENVLRKLFGRESTWEARLLGDLQSYAPLEASFAELMEQYNSKAKIAVDGIDTIENAVTNLPPRFKSVDALATTLESKQAALQQAASDGFFLAPSLFAVLAPAARRLVASARQTAETDPVSAFKTVDGSAQRMAQEGAALADQILGARSGVLAEIARSEAALKARKIETGWIDAELARLSGEAEAIAAAAVEGSVAEKIARLGSEIKSFGEKVAKAVTLATAHARLLERIEQAKGEVAAARKEISQRTKVAEDKLLKEKGWQADNKLFHAKNRADEAAGFLGNGDLDAAEAKIEDARKFGKHVAEILDVSLAAVRGYDKAVDDLTADNARLEGLVPEHQKVLDQIAEGYAASVLKLTAGDAAHPDANGTLKDNVEEAEDHLAKAVSAMKDAAAAFKEGRVLETADLLNQAKGHHDFVMHRFGEITDKQTRLRQTEAANEALLKTLQGNVQSYTTELQGDKKVMKPTLKALKDAVANVEEAAKLVDAKKGDPFKAQDALQASEAELKHVYGNLAPNDRDVYAQADKSVASAAGQVKALLKAADDASGPQVPFSQALNTAVQAGRRLAARPDQLKDSLKESHGDWNAVDHEAEQLGSEAGRLAATIKGEVAKAESAVAGISKAAKRVRQASGWEGSYGIRIDGSPGDSLLESARALLAQGLYAEALRKADQAWEKANNAIAEHEALVEAERQRRARIAEEERQKRLAEERERERQAAEARRRSSDDSSGSWGSGTGGGVFGGFSNSGTGGGSFGGSFSDSGVGGGSW